MYYDYESFIILAVFTVNFATLHTHFCLYFNWNKILFLNKLTFYALSYSFNLLSSDDLQFDVHYHITFQERPIELEYSIHWNKKLGSGISGPVRYAYVIRSTCAISFLICKISHDYICIRGILVNTDTKRWENFTIKYILLQIMH